MDGKFQKTRGLVNAGPFLFEGGRNIEQGTRNIESRSAASGIYLKVLALCLSYFRVARTLNDKLELGVDEKGDLYLFDRDILNYRDAAEGKK